MWWKKNAKVAIADEDKRFIADFYKYGFVGIMLDWIDKGMQEDYHKIVNMMGTALGCRTLRGQFQNFETEIKNYFKMPEMIKILSFCGIFVNGNHKW